MFKNDYNFSQMNSFFPRGFLLGILLLGLVSSASEANGVEMSDGGFQRLPGRPVCSIGVAWDSYQVGVAQELMKNVAVEMRYTSELSSQCVALGVETGSDIRKTHLFGGRLEKSCERDFVRGQKAGRRLDSETGLTCFGAGYSLGMAELHDALRTGDDHFTGDRCMQSYLHGVRDGKASAPETEVGHCYNFGWFENRGF